MNNGMVSVLIILKGRNVNPDNVANIKQSTSTVYKINEIVRIRPFVPFHISFFKGYFLLFRI